MVPPGTKEDTTGVSPLLRLPVADVIEATPPGGPPPAGAGRFAADKVPFTPVDSRIDGRSPATSEQGANDVAVPHVPMTWWEVCPVAAPSVRVEPEMLQISRLAPGGLPRTKCRSRQWTAESTGDPRPPASRARTTWLYRTCQ